tara:strand:+ start:44887 stop:45342 length:456 start_codon:yes stop_codon:yes gene_type:complete
MSKLWDDLKDNMKEWSSSAVEKAEEMSRVAFSKTEELTKISKIKYEIHQLDQEVEGAYRDLGRLAYKHTKKDHMATFSGHTEFFKIVNRVEDLGDQIKKKKNDIDKIKKEYELFHLDQDNLNDELNVSTSEYVEAPKNNGKGKEIDQKKEN